MVDHLECEDIPMKLEHYIKVECADMIGEIYYLLLGSPTHTFLVKCTIKYYHINSWARYRPTIGHRTLFD